MVAEIEENDEIGRERDPIIPIRTQAAIQTIKTTMKTSMMNSLIHFNLIFRSHLYQYWFITTFKSSVIAAIVQK